MLRRRWALAVLTVIFTAYYAFVLAAGHVTPFPAVPLGLTFNSMMDHMLQGRFDVDPDAVQFEAFLRDGNAYTYWGVFFGLLRLPLMLIPGARNLDVTFLSSVVALGLGLWAQLLALRLVLEKAADGPGTRFLAVMMTVVLLLSGAQVAFLRLSIYQEVCFWGLAIGAGFVLLALRGLIEAHFPLARLIAMAVLAGLALNARVSCGVGLYGALGLLVLVEAYLAPSWRARFALIAPLVVLGLFAAVALGVNYERWGDPLVFQDYRHYGVNLEAGHAESLARLDKYGLFNVLRAPFGLIYYFFPIWAAPTAGAPYMFLGPLRQLFDLCEGPPSTFFVTDPVLVGLFVWFVWRAVRGRSHIARPVSAAALLIGLSLAGLILLCAPAMCYRYRLDFYPLLLLGAYLGLNEATKLYGEKGIGALRGAVLGLAALVGVVASHGEMALYKVTPLGSVWRVFPDGVVAGYRNALHDKMKSMQSPHP